MSKNGEKRIPKNEILNELVSRQISDIPAEKKLAFSDLKRISKYLDGSIFDDDTCCLWKGYVTNSNNNVKGTYINFYFRNKKVALHRLLYCNFVSVLTDDEYLKFSCENKGQCCCINHLKKFKYQKRKLDLPEISDIPTGEYTKPRIIPKGSKNQEKKTYKKKKTTQKEYYLKREKTVDVKAALHVEFD